MITGAVIAASITLGAALFVSVVSGMSMRGAFLVCLAALFAGAGLGAWMSTWSGSPQPCPEGTVLADSHNELFSGCIPLDLAEKQLDGKVDQAENS